MQCNCNSVRENGEITFLSDEPRWSYFCIVSRLSSLQTLLASKNSAGDCLQYHFQSLMRSTRLVACPCCSYHKAKYQLKPTTVFPAQLDNMRENEGFFGHPTSAWDIESPVRERSKVNSSLKRCLCTPDQMDDDGEAESNALLSVVTAQHRVIAEWHCLSETSLSVLGNGGL